MSILNRAGASVFDLKEQHKVLIVDFKKKFKGISCK